MTSVVRESDGSIPTGATIGRYVVQGFIARSAMSEVYVAYDPELDRKLAIKLLHAEPSSGPVEGGRNAWLMREAQAIAKLSHPNVVIVHDVGSFGDRVFIAMELIEGATLSAWQRAEPRSWRDILRVFIAAGRGLQHAHEANLVHRDFKPDNVMVRADGQVRVMDFGLVRNLGAPTPAPAPVGSVPSDPQAIAISETVDLGPTLAETTLIETGRMAGTPAYMSPEQLFGRGADARSDQFSFCVALYRALFGTAPFAGLTVDALTVSVARGQITPPPERTEVPVNVWQALRRGLAVSPGNRYPSMSELLADLARQAEPPRGALPSENPLTTAADLAGVLETLLRRPVRARPEETRPSWEEGVVAVYAGEDGAAAALVHFDLLAAASIAAALESLPPDMVEQARRAGKLPKQLMNNLLEVANVLTRVVRELSPARLRIQRLHPLGAAPPDVVAALEAPPWTLSFAVSVGEYPGGSVTLIGRRPRVAAQPRQRETILSRALIVDDSQAMRLVVGRALGRLGVSEILEAPDGEQGLQRLREAAAVDAVFVDWSMPVMDGMTFLKAVRADRRYDDVRLVMVTTEADPAQMEAAFAAGADEYLVKPSSDELLRSKLEGIGLKTS